ncbi:MAG: hypothetical protein ACI9SP_000539 [Arenicella sp.]|jgi:hypothetical protein
MPVRQLLVMFILGIFLSACGNVIPQIDRKTKLKNALDISEGLATDSFNYLTTSLNNGTITNAVVLKSYAAAATSKKPEFKDIIDVLASEGSVRGPTYLSIKTRLETARKKITTVLDDIQTAQSLTTELDNINSATKDYDAMLVDAINVLSDFTDGDLPKLRELEYSGEAQASAPIGSEYVGNTNYGQWQQRSNGTSFWAFYGQYAMFSRLFSSPMSYGGWSNNRRPSYYHDYGRNTYSSTSGRANQNQALQRTKKQYSSQGKTFKSSYARSKPTLKGSAGGTKPTFKSSYARKSSGAGTTSSYAKTQSGNARSTAVNTSSRSSSYNSRSSSRGRSSFGGK